MIWFWHTYVLSYLVLGFIALFMVIQYTRYCNECILDDNDSATLIIACILLWPVFSGAMIYSFYKSHLSYIIAVDLKDIPNAWKAAVENERNRGNNNDDIITISTIQKAEIKSLKAEISKLKQTHANISSELINIKESIPGSGQQRSMKRLANIVRT